MTARTVAFWTAVLLMVLVLVLAAITLNRLDQSSRQSGLQAARDAVRRGVMMCYALEGTFPPDLAYLQDNYGLQLEEGRYVYFYQSIGGNLYPIIDVQLREDVTS